MASHSSIFTHDLGRVGSSSSPSVRQPYSPQDCPPPCPACGGLECLCRPRFFAGQLLTDEDLNLLDRYIVEKNKLHNRYLHGHGIVCGLDVTCHPCDSKSVVVKPGYALSPCGDDIVVCKDSPVNICDLINRCRPVMQDQCDPMHPGPTDTCPEGEQEWILAICYDEKPSRGVAALRAGSSASRCGSCACGGSGSCGCGCHSASNGNGYTKSASTGSQNKKRLAQCEPTLTCETYKFMVYRDRTPKSKASFRFDEEFGKILQQLASTRPTAPSGTLTTSGLEDYAKAYRQWVWEFMSETQCMSGDVREIQQRVGSSPIPPAGGSTEPRVYLAAINPYISNLDSFLLRYLSILLCNLFKLSCPDPVERNCIPLARITVRKPDCHVVSICEASVREYVLSAAMERLYSLVKPWLTTLLGKLCCRPVQQTLTATPVLLRSSTDESRRTVMPGTSGARTTDSSAAPKEMTFPGHLEQAFQRGATRGNIETLLAGLKGTKDEKGNPIATPEELATPASFVIANQLLRPALQSILPVSWDKALELVSQVGAEGVELMNRSAKRVESTSEMETLKTAVAQLQQTVAKQATQINKLNERIPKKK